MTLVRHDSLEPGTLYRHQSSEDVWVTGGEFKNHYDTNTVTGRKVHRDMISAFVVSV